MRRTSQGRSRIGPAARRRLRALLAILLLAGCSRQEPAPAPTTPPPRQVVVYTSVDQNFSEPILRQFATETGIEVLPVYDVEATKTVGLANRLIAEAARPQADVFWNGEFLQTLRLYHQNLLAPYPSTNASSIPRVCKHPDGYWVGFGGRGRILLVNTNQLQGPLPTSVLDLVTDRWPADRIAVALPVFGTSLTHAAALYAQLGPEAARQFYQQLKKRGVRIVDGNSAVRDLVAAGEAWIGLTDTDDALGALRQGAPVQIVYPDTDRLGTMIIPNTVALVAGAPHPAEARALIDYLLSDRTLVALVQSEWIQIPLRPAITAAAGLETPVVRGMRVDSLDSIYGALETAQADLREIFVQ